MKRETRMFFGIEIESSRVTKLPSCFRYNRRRWDYAIKAESEEYDLIKKLKSSGIFRSVYIKESGVWILKEIRH